MNSSNSFLLRDDDTEEQYNFSGATLTISDDEATQNLLRHRTNISDMEKSAILTGSDVTSPIHVTSAYKEIKSNTPIDDGSYMCGPGIRDAQKTDDIPVTDEFFCFRPGQFEKAVADCVNILLRPANDANVVGSWLLTDISHWDHERERIFILTSKTLLDVKYDFIALKILQSNKIRLNQIDTIIEGKLTYPQASLVPRIEGIANGLTSIICGKLFCQSRQPERPNAAVPVQQNHPLTVATRYDFSCFKPVEKSDLGMRIMWNRGRPISLLTSWNPFAEDIPWRTVKDHPILRAKSNDTLSLHEREEFDSKKHIYSAESFSQTLRSIFSNANPDGVDFNCDFKEGPILMENYVGVGAVIHNKHNFGFFKVRGKFSF
ncbi:tumor protein p63-regulated gene 1-like protein isoform X1 [Episyrphus balteatus]|uniref:tumor protein p63-regulated gene 1-like protein isoform X1 n=1 Tax=Episyrphus balteatus TaxID=286459 RepID=UPI002486ADD9|nr:tumor protein p63-regulated gene 1-like protein isoform X1 [Episyrphus balteatus]